jgi:hypothetical protein
MANRIGKIKRVKLKDVWKHEALDLTRWMENNIDVINELLDIELSNVEREKAVGDFSVDLTAEDESGNLVIIENQLAKSDHEHLGKLITYLSSLDAKTAIWIVPEPRPEHTNAVSWLNQSGLARFYLVKIEAIQIDDSPPAPLFTLITGPSAESLEVGKTKKGLSERYILRKKWWTALLERIKNKTKLHANVSPSEYSYISTGAGKRGINYSYNIGQHYGRIELYIDRGTDSQTENKQIFDKLYQHKTEIERVFGGELSWERLETKRASRIARYYDSGGYRDEEDKWPKIQDELIDGMIHLHQALSPYIKKLDIDDGEPSDA